MPDIRKIEAKARRSPGSLRFSEAVDLAVHYFGEPRAGSEGGESVSTATRPAVAHYQYVVSWSPDDGEFVATVVEFPSLSWLADDQSAALRGLEDLVETVIDDLVESGEEVPEPLAEVKYSGRLNLRVDPALHRRLAMEAQRNRVSLNRWVTNKLA